MMLFYAQLCYTLKLISSLIGKELLQSVNQPIYMSIVNDRFFKHFSSHSCLKCGNRHLTVFNFLFLLVSLLKAPTKQLVIQAAGILVRARVNILSSFGARQVMMNKFLS